MSQMTTIANRQMTRTVGESITWHLRHKPWERCRRSSTLGGRKPETAQVVAVAMKSSPERERFSVPHAARDPQDPQVLQDRNLDNEDIFQLIKNPPAMGVVRIFEEPESWDTSFGPVQAVTTQGYCHREFAFGPLMHGRSTMAPLETYSYER